MKKLFFLMVSVIYGVVLGGGLEFVLVCDYCVCLDSDIIKFGLFEV